MCLVVSLTVLAGPPRGFAQEPGPKVGLVVHACVGRFDSEAMAAALRLELSSVFGREPEITLGKESAIWRIEVDCGSAETVALAIFRTNPERGDREQLSLSDVDRSAQPRTIALTLAERVRALALRPEPPAPPAPSQTTAPKMRPPQLFALSTVREPQRAPRTRLAGGLAIGFGALTLAGVVIGGSLLGIGERDPAAPISGLISSGTALLAIGGAALIGTSISLAFWSRHRKISKSYGK